MLYKSGNEWFMTIPLCKIPQKIDGNKTWKSGVYKRCCSGDFWLRARAENKNNVFFCNVSPCSSVIRVGQQFFFYWNLFSYNGWPTSSHVLFILWTPRAPYLSLDLWGLLLRLFELLPQGEDLPDAPVPAALCRGLPIKRNVLLDGGVHQATVPRLGHGHVALRHDLIAAGLHILPL